MSRHEFHPHDISSNAQFAGYEIIGSSVSWGADFFFLFFFQRDMALTCVAPLNAEPRLHISRQPDSIELSQWVDKNATVSTCRRCELSRAPRPAPRASTRTDSCALRSP